MNIPANNNNHQALQALLSELRSLQIVLSLTASGQLKISGEKARLTPTLIAEIKAHKTQIVSWLSQHQAQQTPPIIASGCDTAPLSSYQRGIWFLMQVEPDSSAYNCHFEFDISGEIDGQRLHRAWLSVLERHTVLRSRYGMAQGAPYQQVVDIQEGTFTELDFSSRSRQALDNFCAQFIGQSFDLQSGPLCQMALLSVAQQQAVLLICMHHIVIDLWSVEILMNDLISAYQQDAPLAPLPVQYLDFAQWQCQQLSTQRQAQQATFWQSYLAGASKTSLVNKDVYHNPAALGIAADIQAQWPLAKAVAELANTLEITPYSIYLCAFGLTLSCLTDELDVTIGTPLVNRPTQQLDQVIGYFTNVLPLRLQVDGEQSSAQLLQAHYQALLTLFDNQDMTLDQIAQLVDSERDLSHSPLFNIVFTYHNNTQASTRENADFNITSRAAGSVHSQFELSVTLTTDESQAGLSIEYDQGLLSAQSVQQLANAYRAVLDAILRAPQQSWRALALPGAPAYCFADNATLPVAHNWLTRFVAQQQKTPDALACIDPGEQLSYRQMWQRICALSAHFAAQGVSKGEYVALHVPGGCDFSVAWLACMKLGAIALPLDVTLPIQRKLDMLSLCDCRFLLGETLPESELAITPLSMMTSVDDRAAQDEDVAACRADDGALLVFTSGSTGQPKAVLLAHAGLNTMSEGMQAALSLAPGKRMLQMASVGFSVIIEECMPAWGSGAAVVFCHEQERMHPESICAVIAREQISALELSVSLWKQLIIYLEQSQTQLPDSLQTVLLGCETINKRWLQRWQPYGVDVLTVFGLSETSVTNATYRWQAGDEVEQSVLPMGDVFAGTNLYVLDRFGRPVMEEAYGELYIGGPAIQGRYVNNPQAQANYLPDPFTTVPGAQMFRTGDVVKRLSQQRLLYLGRRDRQLKINGHRIELGEIERVLSNIEAVKLSFVRCFKEGDKATLCAFVCIDGSLDEQAILQRMRAQLPYYMVPGLLCELQQVPYNANGKVDEKQLRQVYEAQLTQLSDAAVALDETQRQIAQLFCTLLQCEQLGPQAHFFRLGGHSLLAMQLLTRLNKQFDIELSVKSIFENPTIAALAQQVKLAPKRALPALVATSPQSRQPLSFAQRRIWFIDQLGQGSAQYNMPSAFRLQGPLCRETFIAALAQLLARHTTLRTVYRQHSGEPYAELLNDIELTPNYHDLSHLETAQKELALNKLAAQDAGLSFDLSADLMLRVTLIRLSANVHAVLLNVHHIAADGLSVSILFNELAQLYQSALLSTPASLPTHTIDYGDYALWQQQWLDSAQFEQELDYWLDELQGAPQVHSLPLDRARPKVQTFAGAHYFSSLESTVCEQAKALCQQYQVTEFVFWHSALALTLARYSQSADVVIGTPVSGRVDQQLETQVGCFINTLALRTQFAEDDSFDAVLKRNQSTMTGALSHQHVPFEYIVDKLNPERSTSHSPVFQVLFRVDDFEQETEQFAPQLKVLPQAQENSTTQYELTVSATPNEEQMTFCWSYATALFDEQTLIALSQAFAETVKAVVAMPARNIWQFPLCSATTLVNEQPICAQTGEALLPAMALAQQRFAERTAVVCNEQSLSYAQFAQQAAQLAGHIRAQGVMPGQVVGIMMPRSIEMLVSMYAVLQSGAVLLPLDTSYPAQRLAHVVQDSGVSLILTQGMALPEGIQAHSLDISTLDTSVSPVALDWPEPEQPAYLLYTSGTTGKPKGILVSHKSLGHFVSAMNVAIPSSACDFPWLMLTSINFDISLYEWLGCLTRGGVCYLADDQQLRDPRALVQLLNARRYGFIQTTPSRWTQLFDAGLALHPGVIAASGGEALPPALIEQFRQQQAKLVNCYGPTEATVWSMVRTVPLSQADADTAQHLGSPLPGYGHIVLDNQLQCAPLRSIGELGICGPALAIGYHGRDKLTKQKFVTLNINGVPTRVYRTGDKVRQLDAGLLQYCGRVDHQVKLRGYRIELEEIERHLSAIDGIKQAVVTLNEQQLSAYVVPEDAMTGHALVTSEQAQLLRQALLQSLPEYMIPSVFVALDALPKTLNGKLDRAQLPVPQTLSGAQSETPPEGEYEQFVAHTWAELIGIGVESISRHDNFFALGGHSLLVVRFLDKVHTHYDVNLAVSTLFESADLAQFAMHLENAYWSSKELQQETDMDVFEL
ncbi:hypothetical protein C3B51_03995 [Pseudoalteromonas rubra]|uniref:Carrier domain-containing protein n=1 Tax=Pseudoalteromonas rubra TaxID=43658 RepID=A0A4Q7EKY1_9GAMM|nr:non-ribosomal peptide synthetase [Pseudoalteromonas rubra]RZM84279.1 hypothetical protein C3B51_03995 [Pseudoalteromonas rubra]